MDRLRRELPSLAALAQFEAAARLQSFTAAAAELHVTQAAISRQIKVLEESLGVQLFERRHRAVFLTEDGREFFEKVSNGLKTLARACAEVRRRGEDRGVTIYCELSLAAYWLVPRLPDFEQRHPDISVRVISSNQALDRIAEPFDLGLQTSSRTSGTFNAEVSVCEEIFPICSPDYIAKSGGQLDISTISNGTLLSLRDEAYQWLDWYDWLAHFGRQIGPAANVRAYNNYSVLLQAVISGQGVALGWRHSIERLLEDGTLVRPLEATFETEDSIFLYRSARGVFAKQNQAVFIWLKDQLLLS